MVREVGKAVVAAAKELTVEAQHSITAGSSSGKKKGSKHLHVPSKPGEPPNNFEGHLADNIEFHRTSPLTAEVSSNASYSAALEFGTSKMAERPYMRPAAQKTRPEAQRLVAEAVKRVVKGGSL